MRNTNKKILLPLDAVAAIIAINCKSYQYAKNVKLISFEDSVVKGKSAGPIEGQSCTWKIMGYQVSDSATLDRAMANARSQAKTGVTDIVTGGGQGAEQPLRYLNYVNTDWTGFNAMVVAKNCIVAKGTGFR